MFHATIRSEERGPLRLSGEASPYNLQMLRDHLAHQGAGTRVEVRLAAALHPTLRRALGDLERRGVVVVLEP
jgi:sirohydrochlorin ferrochelatase